MMSPRIAFAAIAIAAACASGSALAERTIGKLIFRDCGLNDPVLVGVLDARCANWTVPENPAEPNGRKIALRIGLVPAKTVEPEPDPVFFLAGGPGQSALESFPQVAAGFSRIREKRHIVLVDQRGTGGSNRLVCKGTDEANPFGIAPSDDPKAQTVFAKRCAKRLSEYADPRFYTTTIAVGDLDAIREALGATQVNLVGVSYGTRVAQTYLRYYPNRVRSMILDGVVPATLALGNDHAKNLETALTAIFARCHEDAACIEAFGDPAKNLARLKLQLRVHEPLVRYRDPLTWTVREQPFGVAHLATAMRLFAYQPETAALIPFVLNEAVNGRFETLRAQFDLITGELGESIMHGMQLSVICSEEVDRYRLDPEDADRLLGTEMIEMLQAQCAGWPKGERPPDFHDPLTSDVPVLLLSGEFDPVTPPRYGEQAVQGFSRGRHLIVPGRGHIVLNSGCVPKLAATFIDRADAQSLDAHCLDVMPAIPPFRDANGWGP